jgi:3',5'-cyclic AMP phosphodiesterase CpdA
MKRLILRFANREGINTIERHRELLRPESGVWWGWFKKAHEPFPQSDLRELSASLPDDVGLVNREEGKLYFARCERIDLAAQANGAIATPDPLFTPDYYRDAYLPAWFFFKHIEEATSSSFVQRFESVPVGDPTLFIVVVEDEGPRLQAPIEHALPDPPEASGESLLHISDLHFEDFHGFGDPRRPATPGMPHLSSTLTDFLNSRRDISIAAVIASGDFTSRGSANGLSLAEALLNDVVGCCQLSPEHVVMIPGNHDIWLEAVEHFDRNYIAESPYRQFMRSFYGAPLPEIEQIRRVATTARWEIRFVAVNSARAREEALKEYGYVGQDRYRPLLNVLEEEDDGASPTDLLNQRKLNIFVIHHHVLPAALLSWPQAQRPVSLTLDAGALIADIQDAAIHAIVHGHQHVPFAGVTGRVRSTGATWAGPDRSVAVLGCGSTGCAMSELTNELRENSFSIYTPTDQGLRVEVFRFNPGLTPSVLRDTLVPL